jgi:hypothetical protein
MQPLRLMSLHRRGRWPFGLRLLDALFLLAILFFILQNRLALGRAFLFVYADEDQTLLWYAGMDLLHGRIPEPCFYGQAFSSCLEGYLAAPLLWAHMPPWYALPAVTLGLGLLPFLAIALAAWRRHRPALAGLALLIPAALPVRYAMLTGMPRGFVTGIALAILPCLLLLDPPAAPPLTPQKTRRRWRDPVRFFGIGLLAVLALTINPNCALLLAPALAFALAARLRHAAFWLYASLGALIGSLYPVGLFFFYYKLHDDYRFYHREAQLTWSRAHFREFFQQLAVPFWDFLPVNLPYAAAGWFLGGCFAMILLHLLLTRRFAAALATLAAVGFTLFSLGFARVHEGRSSVFFAYGRMYLALPVLPGLLLLWGDPRPKRPVSFPNAPLASAPEAPVHAASSPANPSTPAAAPACGAATLPANAPAVAARATAPSQSPQVPRVPPALRLGLARTLLLAFCILAFLATRQRTREIPAVVAHEVRHVEMVELIANLDGWQLACALQDAARACDAHVVLLVGTEKRWTYLLPVMLDCQSLYPAYERRTWRLVEESLPRHQRILVLDRALFDQARRADSPHATILRQTPFIGVFDTRGQSLIRLCQELYVPIRPFRVPENADVLR